MERKNKPDHIVRPGSAYVPISPDQPAIDLNGQVQVPLTQLARPVDTLTEPVRVRRAHGELGAIVGTGHPGAMPLVCLFRPKRSEHNSLAPDHDHEFTLGRGS
jgi:hypothetical protein